MGCRSPVAPKAHTNPHAGESVHTKRVHAILKGPCYDDPEDPDDFPNLPAAAASRILKLWLEVAEMLATTHRHNSQDAKIKSNLSLSDSDRLRLLLNI